MTTVQSILKDADLTLSSVNELPRELIDANGIVEIPFKDWHLSVAKGIVAAATTLRNYGALQGKSSLIGSAYEEFKKSSRIVFANLTWVPHASMAFTHTSDSPYAYFLVNTSEDKVGS